MIVWERFCLFCFFFLACFFVVTIPVQIDFILSVGDNFYPAGVNGVLEPFAADFTSSEFLMWERVFLKHSQLRVPWYAVLGNHDYIGQWQAQIAFTNSKRNPHHGLWRMPDRNYVVENDIVSIIAFDANACQYAVRRAKPDVCQVLEKDKAWLMEAIQQCKNRSRWVVLMQHHPFYTNGRGHFKEAQCLRLSKESGGLDLERHISGVDVVIAGHEHMMMAKCVGEILHVSSGASVESTFYKGGRKEADMDWKQEDVTGFLSFEASEDELKINFVNSVGLETVKSYSLKKR